MKDREVIRRIGEGNAAIETLYRTYRGRFLGWMWHDHRVPREEALDLFQDVLAALVNNVRSGRLTPDNLAEGTLKTYLFNTGRFILFNRRRKREVPLTFDSDLVMREDEEGFLPAEDDREEQDKLSIIRRSVQSMPQPCKGLLIKRYFGDYSSGQIARQMSYGSERSVNSQVYKCKQKLRAIVLSRFKDEGYVD